MAGKKGMKRSVPGRTARQQAWQSMQIFINFTMDDILATANIEKCNLGKYLQLLKRYGYVEETGQIGKSGQLHHRKIFELICDTGPHCPIAYRKTGLRDLNAGETFLPEEEEI